MSLVKRVKKWLESKSEYAKAPPGLWLNDPKLNKLFNDMIKQMRKNEPERLKRALERLDKP